MGTSSTFDPHTPDKSSTGPAGPASGTATDATMAAQAAAPEGIDLLGIMAQAERISKDYQKRTVEKSLGRSYRAWHNEHAEGSKYLGTAFRGRSRLFVPKTRSAVRKNLATAASALFSTEDVVNVSAEYEDDPVQRSTAAVIKADLDYRLTRSSPKSGMPWYQIAMGACLDGQLTGIVISKQHWEYEEVGTGEFEEVMMPKMRDDGTVLELPVADPATGGQAIDEAGQPKFAPLMEPVEREIKRVTKDRPMIDLIPIENIGVDPAAPWYSPVQLGRWFYVNYPMGLSDARAMIESDGKDGIDRGWLQEVTDATLLKGRQEDDRTGVRRAREGGGDRYEDAKALGELDIVWVRENFIRIAGIDWHFRSVGRFAFISKVRRVYEVYPEYDGERPYTFGVCQLDTHRVFPMSPVDSWQPLQLELNDITNLRQDTLKLDEVAALRAKHENYFAPGAQEKYYETESSFTPDTPIDDTYVNTMARILLDVAVRKDADAVGVSTTATSNRIQNTAKAGHFYDNQMKPRLERELRRISGDASVKLELVELPRALGGRPKERPYTIWAVKLAPEVKAVIRREGQPVMAVGAEEDGDFDATAFEQASEESWADIAATARAEGEFEWNEANLIRGLRRAPDKGYAELEAQRLERAVESFEKKLINEDLPSAEIAEAIERYFGFPVDAAAYAAGRVWWKRLKKGDATALDNRIETRARLRGESDAPAKVEAATALGAALAKAAKAKPAETPQPAARGIGFRLSQAQQDQAKAMAARGWAVGDITNHLAEQSDRYVSPAAVSQTVEPTGLRYRYNGAGRALTEWEELVTAEEFSGMRAKDVAAILTKRGHTASAGSVQSARNYARAKGLKVETARKGSDVWLGMRLAALKSPEVGRMSMTQAAAYLTEKFPDMPVTPLAVASARRAHDVTRQYYESVRKPSLFYNKGEGYWYVRYNQDGWKNFSTGKKEDDEAGAREVLAEFVRSQEEGTEFKRERAQRNDVKAARIAMSPNGRWQIRDGKVLIDLRLKGEDKLALAEEYFALYQEQGEQAVRDALPEAIATAGEFKPPRLYLIQPSAATLAREPNAKPRWVIAHQGRHIALGGLKEEERDLADKALAAYVEGGVDQMREVLAERTAAGKAERHARLGELRRAEAKGPYLYLANPGRGEAPRWVIIADRSTIGTGGLKEDQRAEAEAMLEAYLEGGREALNEARKERLKAARSDAAKKAFGGKQNVPPRLYLLKPSPSQIPSGARAKWVIVDNDLPSKKKGTGFNEDQREQAEAALADYIAAKAAGEGEQFTVAREQKPPRLALLKPTPAQLATSPGRKAVWIIVDADAGKYQIRTGFSENQRAEAEQKLAEYVTSKADSEPRRAQSAADSRRAVKASIKARMLARQPVSLKKDASALLDALAGETSMVPAGVAEAVITEIRPLRASGNSQDYVVTGVDAFGGRFTYMDRPDRILNTPALFTVSDGRPVVFLAPFEFPDLVRKPRAGVGLGVPEIGDDRLEAGDPLSGTLGRDAVPDLHDGVSAQDTVERSNALRTLRGFRAHEAVHALRTVGLLPGRRSDAGSIWGRLIGHADGSLATLLLTRAEYLAVIGDPRAATVDPDETILEVYHNLYQAYSDKREVMDQEAVALMVQLYTHGFYSDSDIAPVKDLLDALVNGELAQGGKGKDKGGTDPIFAIGGEEDAAPSPEEEEGDWQDDQFANLAREHVYADLRDSLYARDSGKAVNQKPVPKSALQLSAEELEAQVASLDRDLRQQNKTTAEIAAAINDQFGFGVDPDPSKWWWRQAKTAGRHNIWSHELRVEAANLRKSGMPWEDVAEHMSGVMGRKMTVGAVRQQVFLNKLDVGGAKGGSHKAMWALPELSEAVWALRDGETANAVAERLTKQTGRTYTTEMVEQKWKRIAEAQRSSVTEGWPQDQVDELLSVIADGQSFGDAAAHMTRKFGTLRTRNAIAGKITKLRDRAELEGVPAERPDSIWDAAALAELRRVTDLGYTRERRSKHMSGFMGRELTTRGVDAVAARDTDIVQAATPYEKRFWTEPRLAELERIWTPETSYADKAAHMSAVTGKLVPSRAIILIAGKNRERFRRLGADWSQHQDLLSSDFIQALSAKTAARVLSEKLGLDLSAVAVHGARNRYGLSLTQGQRVLLRNKLAGKYIAPDDQGSMVPAPRMGASEQNELAGVLTDAAEIISRIAGKNVRVSFTEKIPVSSLNLSPDQVQGSTAFGRPPKTAGGFYRPGTLNAAPLIGIAFADPLYDARTNAGHEAWHHVEEELANPAELKLIRSDSEMARILPMAAAEIGVEPGDRRLAQMPAKEIRAIAFQRYRREREEGAKPVTGLHIGVRRFWDRVMRVLQNVRNALQGKGYNSFEAVFHRARDLIITRFQTAATRRHEAQAAGFHLQPASVEPQQAVPVGVADAGLV